MATNLMSGPERMFYEELEAIGARVDAFIVRAQRDWFPDLYGYRITRADGSIAVGHVPWDLNTYAAVLAVAKGN